MIKKYIFFVLFLLFFSGCIALNVRKEFSGLSSNFFSKEDIKISCYPLGYDTYLFYGMIPCQKLGNGSLKIAIEFRARGINDVNDIKINSYTIKKNNRKIKKKLIFETKKGSHKGISEITFTSNKFSLFTTKKDVIEIIFDLSIKINGEIINKIISSKYRAEKKLSLDLLIE